MNIYKLKDNLRKYLFAHKNQLPLIDKSEWKRIYQNANLLCDHIFLFNRPLDMEPCYIPYHMKNIDWNLSMNGDPEWIYMLNRHEYLIDLAYAYVDSGNEKYLNCWRNIILDWIKNNPFSDLKFQTSWRTIDTGIRCSSWIKSVSFTYGDLSDEELKMIFASLQEQVFFLKRQYIDKYTLSNWGVLQISGILLASMVCDDLVPRGIIQWAWEELKKQCDLQFHVDGVHWEQSPLYQFEVLFSLFDIYIAAKDLSIAIPFDLEGMIKKVSYATFYMMDPEGFLIPQNDSDYLFIKDVYHRLGRFKDLSLQETFKGIESGNLIYKTNRNYISLWNGKHGSGHGHAGLGHINIFLNGEWLLTDSGRFTYQEGPIRNFLKSAESHNTIIIDGTPPTRIKDSWRYDDVGKPLSNQMKETGMYVVMESVFTFSNHVVQRTVITIKDEDIVVIIDNVDSLGRHRLKRYFQLNPDLVVMEVDEFFLLKGRNTSYFYSLDHENLKSRRSISSKLYNQLTDRFVLVEEKEFADHSMSVNIISSNQISVSKSKLIQHGTEVEAKDHLFLGLQLKTQLNTFDLYYSGNDTFKGPKLYMHNDQYLYHKLTISKNGEVEIIF